MELLILVVLIIIIWCSSSLWNVFVCCPLFCHQACLLAAKDYSVGEQWFSRNAGLVDHNRVLNFNRGCLSMFLNIMSIDALVTNHLRAPYDVYFKTNRTILYIFRVCSWGFITCNEQMLLKILHSFQVWFSPPSLSESASVFYILNILTNCSFGRLLANGDTRAVR